MTAALDGRFATTDKLSCGRTIVFAFITEIVVDRDRLYLYTHQTSRAHRTVRRIHEMLRVFFAALIASSIAGPAADTGTLRNV